MNIDPQVTTATGQFALCGALVYAVRFLTARLLQSQDKLVDTLKETIAANTAALHSMRDAISKCKGPLLTLWFLLVAGVACCGGCSTIRIATPDGAEITARVPAWPWQDPYQVVRRGALSIEPGKESASLAGTMQQNATSTNTIGMLKAVVDAAFSAAAGGL